jgi:hypothetical protein
MPKIELLEKDKADIVEMYRDYGWSVRTLSEEYNVPISEIKSILNLSEQQIATQSKYDKIAHVPEHELEDKIQHRDSVIEDLNKLNLRHTGTIESFRDAGCAIARCPKCKTVMNEIVQDEEGGLHYSCQRCGYNDLNNVVCHDKCCRRGLALLIEKDADVNVDSAVLARWVQNG